MWAGTTDFLLGATATGKDLKDLSALDLVAMAQRDGHRPAVRDWVR